MKMQFTLLLYRGEIPRGGTAAFEASEVEEAPARQCIKDFLAARGFTVISDYPEVEKDADEVIVQGPSLPLLKVTQELGRIYYRQIYCIRGGECEVCRPLSLDACKATPFCVFHDSMCTPNDEGSSY